MSYYQIIATTPGSGTKTIINKNETDVIEYVMSFKLNGTIKEGWGKKNLSYQVYEMKIYETEHKYDKKTGVKLTEFIGSNRNKYSQFDKRVQSIIDSDKQEYRVFIIMPIQGKEYGDQNQQRIFREYDQRFDKLKDTLKKFNCIAIRIDKEFPIDQLVARIKQEIEKAHFLIADLTDERPSCYFECGYGEALKKPIIYMASEMSVIDTSMKTNIHFDVHMNVNFFTNLQEMSKKVMDVINKNKERLFKEISTPVIEKAD